MIDTVPAEQLAGTLCEYRNTRDNDIEVFLQSKALNYENRGLQSDEDLIQYFKII